MCDWRKIGALNPKRSHRFQSSCDSLFHEADVPSILTGEGRQSEDMSQETALDILQERLEKLSKVAEENQAYLAMEDHGSISLTPDGFLK